MSRRRDERVRVDLDAGGIESLPMADITAIMRGAENIIAQGGRTLLGRILKGSRDKDLLQRGLHENPSWGFYRSLANDEILARIDSDNPQRVSPHRILRSFTAALLHARRP